MGGKTGGSFGHVEELDAAPGEGGAVVAYFAAERFEPGTGEEPSVAQKNAGFGRTNLWCLALRLCSGLRHLRAWATGEADPDRAAGTAAATRLAEAELAAMRCGFAQPELDHLADGPNDLAERLRDIEAEEALSALVLSEQSGAEQRQASETDGTEIALLRRSLAERDAQLLAAQRHADDLTAELQRTRAGRMEADAARLQAERAARQHGDENRAVLKSVHAQLLPLKAMLTEAQAALVERDAQLLSALRHADTLAAEPQRRQLNGANTAIVGFTDAADLVLPRGGAAPTRPRSLMGMNTDIVGFRDIVAAPTLGSVSHGAMAESDGVLTRFLAEGRSQSMDERAPVGGERSPAPAIAWFHRMHDAISALEATMSQHLVSIDGATVGASRNGADGPGAEWCNSSEVVWRDERNGQPPAITAAERDIAMPRAPADGAAADGNQGLRAAHPETQAHGSGVEDMRVSTEIQAIRQSGLFDEIYYLDTNADVAEAGSDPLTHFVTIGWKEGRRPSPHFDTDFYIERYPDVAAAGVNPLRHFLEHGWREGRWPNPHFDTAYYLASNSDVAEAGSNPLVHYLHHGWREGRRPHPTIAVIFPRDNEDSPPTASDAEPVIDPFYAWLQVNRWNSRQEKHLRQRLARAQNVLPRISVIMPVYNTPAAFLRRAIESVHAQIYGDWELCLSDNCSTNTETRKFLQSLSGVRSVSVAYLPENLQISRNTNNAARSATGEFLLFLDSDDELTVDALAEIALYVAENPRTDLVYSDTDKIDEYGRRYDPAFKPDWAPEMLLSFMYAGQVLAIRRKLFEALGGMRVGCEGSQDHDLALRAGERARHVGHIPKILYHWRRTPGSVSEQPYSVVAGQKAVQESLERRGSRGIALRPEWAQRNSVYVHRFPADGPSVTVILPTGGKVDLLRTCLKGLLEDTKYPILELIILHNTATRPEVFPFLDELAGDRRIRLLDAKGGFNFSRICNLGASAARGEFLLLLNDDIEVTDPDWLSNMMGYAQLDGVGAVGAQLRFPDGRIQHAGIVHGLHDGIAGHAFKLLPEGQNGYLSLAEIPRNCIAVTAACLVTPRRLYLEVGGFDPEHFGVAYNDPDYCYRLLQRGYRIVYAPNARLIHHEGASRSRRDDPRELAAFRQRYGDWRDRYYNPNLSLQDEQFRIAPRCVVLGERRHIRTAVFTHNLSLEGAPISQCQLVTALARQSVLKPTILSPIDGPLRAAYEAAGCPVILDPVPIAPGAPLDDYRRGVTELTQRLMKLDVELVYANTLQTYYAVDAARGADLAMVLNIRESEDWRHYYDWLSPEVRARICRNFAYPYRVVFVAHATRRRYAELETHHNFTVIHNGLALGSIEEAMRRHTREHARGSLGVAETETAFLLLGTVCERKGQCELIEAGMQLVRSEWKRLRLFIVGDRPGPYSEDLHALIRLLPEWAAERVTVVPETEDVALYYRAADAFVCTSRIESYPRVILEAMAYGLPIVTTPVFGIAEQVQDGVNALFYEPGDRTGLAAHLSALLEDPKRRAEMAAASPVVLRSLTSFEEMCRAYGEIFREASLSSIPAGEGRFGSYRACGQCAASSA